MKKFNIFIALVVVGIVAGMYFLGSRNISNNGSVYKAGAGLMDDLVGAPIPEFFLADLSGKVYSSENLKGKTYVLFFNEGLMCYPACWDQMAEFGKDPRFNSDDLQAFSVVVDSKSDWQYAISKMPDLAKASVLFDSDTSVSKRFNMLTANSSMHYGAMPGHTYVVVDKNGTVRYVYDDPTMAINNDMIFDKVNEMNK